MAFKVELDQKRLRGCSLERSFPYVVKNEQGEIVQYAKTQEGADEWIRKQGSQPTGGNIAD